MIPAHLLHFIRSSIGYSVAIARSIINQRTSMIIFCDQNLQNIISYQNFNVRLNGMNIMTQKSQSFDIQLHTFFLSFGDYVNYFETLLHWLFSFHRPWTVVSIKANKISEWITLIAILDLINMQLRQKLQNSKRSILYDFYI